MSDINSGIDAADLRQVPPPKRLPLLSRPAFHRWAIKLPFSRPFARREGKELFRIIQGFVESQVLLALVELDIFQQLSGGPVSLSDLSRTCAIRADRLDVLLTAGVALKLLRKTRAGSFALARRGKVLLGIPGLADMIRHHSVLYADLRNPTDVLRAPEASDLAKFWPYVFSGSADVSQDDATRYSRLMTDSQALVAQDTLDLVRFGSATHIMDIGGGSGAFLCALGQKYTGVDLTLFDLPGTQCAARRYLQTYEMADRIRFVAGSFREAALPSGADVITLVRVCYDHADETVQTLLSACFEALPSGGRLIISEPMSGGARPDPITDIYFAFYTMAMGTGRTRSSRDLTTMLNTAGFDTVRAPRTRRSYVTTVLEAVK